jgi:GNAT superfamily N-acetyltransferase
LIRPAVKEDAPIILQLIKELAEYEKAPNEVIATIKDIEATIFAEDPKVFCELVEIDGNVVGMAIWFLNYSTWQGRHGIYLEDLYIKPEFRGKGLGKALLQHLARICSERGYGRFQWWVLDWNSPAIEFYHSIGAVPMSEWTVFRVSGEPLRKLAD